MAITEVKSAGPPDVMANISPNAFKLPDIAKMAEVKITLTLAGNTTFLRIFISEAPSITAASMEEALILWKLAKKIIIYVPVCIHRITRRIGIIANVLFSKI